MGTRAFGWLPIRIDDAGTGWSLRTLPHFDEAVEKVQTSRQADKEWYWPDIVVGPPSRPAKIYHLPTTHEVEVELPSSTEEERFAEFLIAIVGFLYGILLTPKGWVQFNRVSIDPHRWQDFGMTDAARRRIVDSAAKAWIANPGLREDLFGIIWWHTYAVAYDHPFERFMAQYQVLDACWAVHAKRHQMKSVGHRERIRAMAKFYGLECPTTWSSAKDNDAIAEIRNQVIHQAKWGGQAIGFSHPASPNRTIHLELYWFNSRLILALLGEDNKYVHSRIVRQPYLIK